MLATVDTNEGERSRVRAAAMRKRHVEKPDGPRNVIPAVPIAGCASALKPVQNALRQSKC
jgi:hypothetical protein